jgi:hypothetical protein
MSVYNNGWTREKVMEQIKKRNIGEQAYESGECLYRTSNGNCCLVGCFIPDDKYRESMESTSAFTVITENNLEKYMPLSPRAMEALQQFHDDLSYLHGNKFFDAIEEELLDIEKEY